MEIVRGIIKQPCLSKLFCSIVDESKEPQPDREWRCLKFYLLKELVV